MQNLKSSCVQRGTKKAIRAFTIGILVALSQVGCQTMDEIEMGLRRGYQNGSISRLQDIHRQNAQQGIVYTQGAPMRPVIYQNTYQRVCNQWDSTCR